MLRFAEGGKSGRDGAAQGGTARGRGDGQRQRLGDHEARGRAARRLRHRQRAARAVGAPHARRHVRVCRGRRPAGTARHHRRRRRRRPPSGHAGRQDHRAGAGRAGAVEVPAWRGLAAIRSCRCRRAFPSRPLRSARPAPPMPGSSRSPSSRHRRRRRAQARGVSREADGERTRDARAAARNACDSAPRSRPAHGSACWAAASWAGCSAWPRRAWATASRCSIPAATGPAASVADRHIAAGLSRRARARGARRRSQPRPRPSSRTCRRPRSIFSRTRRASRPSAASVAIAQDRISEKMFLSGHGFAVAPFAVLRSSRRRRWRRRARLVARHREERALRLRRQGTGRASRPSTTYARRGAA